MEILDLTFPQPSENLACDEALLERCENRDGPEILRFWESADYFVVIGYSDRLDREVRAAAAREKGVPVLRRISGGGTVLQGPGCVNFSLLMRIENEPRLKSIRETNRFVLERHAAAVEKITGLRAEIRGASDLAAGGLKFSGNAQRRRKNFLLFHGTFLLDLDFPLLEDLLPLPSKQPDYRAGRPHTQFLRNLNVPAAEIKKALCEVWNASEEFRDIPAAEIKKLAREKYLSGEWNEKR